MSTRDGDESGTTKGAMVQVMPLDIAVEVLLGETLLQAGQRMGLRWPSICGGQGICTTCYISIQEGFDAAAPKERYEAERLDFAGKRDPAVRLACQLRVRGPMRVFQRGVRRLPGSTPQNPA